jgi:hypothetical protein
MPIRLCGSSRKLHALYLETQFGPGGVPFGQFMLDPTLPIMAATLKKWGVNPLGMTIVRYKAADGKDIVDVVDWIGESHYPHVWDFFNEARIYGLSRAASPTPALIETLNLDVPGHYILLHPKGHLMNAHQFYVDRALEMCVHSKPEHVDRDWELAADETCFTLLRETFTGKDLRPTDVVRFPASPSNRELERNHPSGSRYHAYLAPPDVEPVWRPAIVAKIPKSQLRWAVIGGNSTTEKKLDKHSRNPWSIKAE